jgi:DNA polymerase III epsilon subunit-like protein
MSRSFIVVDLEATDKLTCNAQILSGCFLHCDESLQIKDRLDIKARPLIWDRAAEESVQIHGITREQAMMCEPWSVVGENLVEWLRSKPVSHFVCHSNRTIFGKFFTYDYAVLKTNLMDLGLHWDLYLTCPERMIISTHSLAKSLQYEMSLQGSLDLKTLSQILGVKLSSHHTADADALACLGILGKLLPRVDLAAFLDKEYFKLQGERNDTDRTDRASKKRTRKTETLLQATHSQH